MPICVVGPIHAMNVGIEFVWGFDGDDDEEVDDGVGMFSSWRRRSCLRFGRRVDLVVVVVLVVLELVLGLNVGEVWSELLRLPEVSGDSSQLSCVNTVSMDVRKGEKKVIILILGIVGVLVDESVFGAAYRLISALEFGLGSDGGGPAITAAASVGCLVVAVRVEVEVDVEVVA